MRAGDLFRPVRDVEDGWRPTGWRPTGWRPTDWQVPVAGLQPPHTTHPIRNSPHIVSVNSVLHLPSPPPLPLAARFSSTNLQSSPLVLRQPSATKTMCLASPPLALTLLLAHVTRLMIECQILLPGGFGELIMVR